MLSLQKRKSSNLSPRQKKKEVVMMGITGVHLPDNEGQVDDHNEDVGDASKETNIDMDETQPDTNNPLADNLFEDSIDAEINGMKNSIMVAVDKLAEEYGEASKEF
ncbi:hypothetical protein JCGZ_08258 [Jatropha curcas]|uniref:Uncharacterized protein n=1 Tax=Jatropha curcas TaxID=180498 RepID=A0A067KN45_JATCU|nr:hypothetical protein JCGZ_08258 [Jatropha curcas]